MNPNIMTCKIFYYRYLLRKFNKPNSIPVPYPICIQLKAARIVKFFEENECVGNRAAIIPPTK